MKVKIRKEVYEEQEVQFPRYYLHDCGGDNYDSLIYGRVTEDKHVQVQFSHSFTSGERSVEFEVDKTSFPYLSCYFEKQFDNTCDEQTFNYKFAEALDFAENLQ